jgi:[protein-PII] uridylyltransferase
VHQLEPDVKRSPGGLRDVHLIGWLALACHGANSIDSIRLQGLLSPTDSHQLVAAYEFLMKIRMDLHYHAGRAQERLTRDEQLRLAEQRDIAGTSGQRPVERLMQQYFRHAAAVLRIANQFAEQHQPRSLSSRVLQAIVSHRFDGVFNMGPRGVTVRGRDRETVCCNLESILKLYHAASLYGARVAPEMTESIKSGMTRIRSGLSDDSARHFRKIMRTSGNLGPLLRQMYDTGVLEHIVPDMTHARCLLQFNQYHSYTVDEHTLRAIEIVESFEHDPGSLGTAYREIRHKATLHLAILLHDLGKGFDEDHSDVGARIAERIGIRLQISPHKREILVRLVQNHLSMAHLAFRRDFSDLEILLPFSRMVGSPEVLRMLYVLTAADVAAVGPDVWTEWKAELLSELYERVLLIVSGKQYEGHDAERRESVKQYVQSAIVPLSQTSQSDWDGWIDSQLQAFPSHYISGVSLENITADLDSLQQLGADDVIADGQFHAATTTVDYRIITQGKLAEGCFHKLAGVLTAKHLEVLTAQISTSKDGVVLDRFRVIDHDFAESVPVERIQEVTQAVQDTLYGRTTVEQLFHKHQRFGGRQTATTVSNLPPRVVIDNNSTDSATIIDVFAYDSPGLLYTLAKAVYDLDLSVMQARIGTHLDQVVDVFYVSDRHGNKIRTGSILQEIKDTLTQQISDFEHSQGGQFTT